MKNVTGLFWFIALTVFSVVSVTGQTTGSFRQEGVASIYGATLAGRPTASGEAYNPDNLTAAHPTLPFGSVLRVTNTLNMQQVTVRINDRGPFMPGRLIELSRAAGDSLGIPMTGTARVIIEQVGGPPAPTTTAPAATPPPAAITLTPTPLTSTPPPSATYRSDVPPPIIQVVREEPPLTTPPQITQVETQRPVIVETVAPVAAAPVLPPQGPPATLTGASVDPTSANLYRLRLGSFRDPANAVNVFERLAGAGLAPRYEPFGDLYRVVLPYIRAADVSSIARILGNIGFTEAFVQVETQVAQR
ncbi:MAG: septal ring lytic transglycosylase RlpA family protein [Treponema sp.]|nr:septal ring lytic transglycosylase RlpA family protein [Treponema sp.]